MNFVKVASLAKFSWVNWKPKSSRSVPVDLDRLVELAERDVRLREREIRIGHVWLCFDRLAGIRDRFLGACPIVM